MTNDAKMNRDYRFYAEPLSNTTNELIAVYLNALGDSAFSCEHQSIEVNGKTVYGVYELPHSLLTKITKTEHLKNVRFYEQEGEGTIRPYKHFVKRLHNLGRTKAIKTITGAIRKMK